eukprot:jgi/Mesen1/8097/ME000434S07334
MWGAFDELARFAAVALEEREGAGAGDSGREEQLQAVSIEGGEPRATGGAEQDQEEKEQEQEQEQGQSQGQGPASSPALSNGTVAVEAHGWSLGGGVSAAGLAQARQPRLGLQAGYEDDEDDSGETARENTPLVSPSVLHSHAPHPALPPPSPHAHRLQRRSSLKATTFPRAPSDAEAAARRTRRVQWPDDHGDSLTHVKEFEARHEPKLGRYTTQVTLTTTAILTGATRAAASSSSCGGQAIGTRASAVGAAAAAVASPSVPAGNAWRGAPSG